MVDRDSLTAGDVVSVSFYVDSPIQEGRIEKHLTVKDASGETVWFESPYDEGPPTIILDPSDSLIARGEQGRDGYFASHARIESPVEVA